MKYYISKNGYYYKEYKNGKKVRISKKSAPKKMIGGGGNSPNNEEKLDDDVLFQSENVCILKPESNHGILILTRYVPNSDVNICDDGLKTGEQLHKEGLNFGRSIYHPYIFFRAPYKGGDIDYTSIDTEIHSLYGELDIKNTVFIRVDPNKTFVYSSEIRATKPQNINYSKKLLSDYMLIIQENEEIKYPWRNRHKPRYHLFTSKKNKVRDNVSIDYPYNQYPIERNSEILVDLPHLTPNYFVLCT